MDEIDSAMLETGGESEVRFRTARARIELKSCQADILRIRVTVDGAAASSLLPPRSWEGASLSALGELRYSSGALTVEAALRPFRLDLEMVPCSATLKNLRVRTDATRAEARIRVTVPHGHHFYGLGHGGQQFDRLGSVRRLWNSHTLHGSGSDFAVPLILSQAGYALFFDSAWEGTIAIAGSDEGTHVDYCSKGGQVDLYVLTAASPRLAMKLVAELLGQAPLPPKWLLGYMQSTRHFLDARELEGLATELRSRGFPCDSLVFLSTYGEELGWNHAVGSLDFQPELWPDPGRLIARMREQHFEVVTHEYPVVHPEATLFEEARANGYLLAEGYAGPDVAQRPRTGFHEGQRYLDFSNQAARAWWWRQHRELVKLGVAGWWLDGGEGPSADAQLTEGGGAALHNRYDLLRQRAFAEGEDAERPDQRIVMLCRSGAAGMQRYGAACWSGDVDNTFATLAAQIPRGLNLALSGIPYWGTDIGGFFHAVEESGELFARWFQFGAFCPIFRAHGYVWREHLPWAHGPDIERICRRYVELRYELLPYTYTLAHEASEQGLPLMRPLCLNYPDDPRVYEMGNEYLWGDDLLAAPVTAEGARRWSLYLPEGCWHDFWTHERYEGGQGIEVDAPLERMPLFVREGAIIPLGPALQHTRERPLEQVTVLVYPSEDSFFELYEDDGISRGYQHGAFALTRFRCTRDRARVSVEIGPPRGDRSVVPPNRSYLLKIRIDPPVSVEMNGAPLRRLSGPQGSQTGWWYDGRFAWVSTVLPSASVEVHLA